MFDPSDISQNTIKALFHQQIKRLTMKSCGIGSFDYQFSDQWL